MTQLHVDRLTLQLAGLSEPEARRLVVLIGEHIATTAIAGPGRNAAQLHVEVTAIPNESLDDTARRIADELAAALVVEADEP